MSALVLRKTCATVPIGVQLRVVGKPIHLVKWHSERGFAGVPEFAMKQLHRHLGYPEPGVAPPGVTMADHLACSLVLAATPKLTKAGLQAILQCRRMYDEQVAIEDDSELTQNILDDVMLAGDRKGAADRLEAMRAEVQSRKKRSAALLKLVEVSAPRLEKEPKVKAPPS